MRPAGSEFVSAGFTGGRCAEHNRSATGGTDSGSLNFTDTFQIFEELVVERRAVAH
jgi:hypothetical protein